MKGDGFAKVLEGGEIHNMPTNYSWHCFLSILGSVHRHFPLVATAATATTAATTAVDDVVKRRSKKAGLSRKIARSNNEMRTIK